MLANTVASLRTHHRSTTRVVTLIAALLTFALILGLSPTLLPDAAAEDALAVCPERFAITRSAATQHLAYCSSQPLHTQDDSITRLVVVVHGDGRNAVGYLNYAQTSAGLAQTTGALLVAPQFLTPDDLPSPSTTLTWSSGGWKRGDVSTAEGSAWRISSFEVLDRLVTSIADASVFPNLRTVVIAGHSAGGQYTLRHGAISDLAAALEGKGQRTRYVVANPSSYLYLDGARPKSVKQGYRFALPSDKDIAACDRYDTYKYGLVGLNSYAKAKGEDIIRRQLQDRAVTYLLGESDTSTTDNLDTTCAANLQGPNRFERGRAFHAYLGHHYGSTIYTAHVLRTVPKVGHSGRGMLTSPEGQQALFN
jgi:hypothetical protein